MQLSGIFGTCFLAAVLLTFVEGAAPYYGTFIASFKTYVHEVVGDVYVVDERTVFIKGFSYDGQGPDAYFWGGSTNKPDSSGFIIPDEKGKKTPLKEYRNKDILLRLPAGKTLRNIKWLSVWCRKFNANFGDVFIPSNLVIPHPVEIGRIPSKEHRVASGPVMVVDTQTLLVPEFSYDGSGPAAYWWVSRGSRQHPRGVRLADENGSYAPLPKYTGRTVVITLPDEYTIYDFDWFGVWSEDARTDFGSVALPQDIVVPPSPRTLGIELEYKLNCEVLHDGLGYEVRWIMDGEDIVLQLVAKLQSREYMAFGLSKNDTKSDMSNADAIVAFTDKRKKGHAVDYFLRNQEQCVGRRGSCPDTKLPDGQDSVTLLNSAVVNGYTMITVKRPQVGLDEKYDQHVYSDGPQAIVWAVGQLNERNEVSFSGVMKPDGDIYIDFARPPQWNCPQPADPESDPEFVSSTTVPATSTGRLASDDRNRRPESASSTSQRKPQPIGPRYVSRASDARHGSLHASPGWTVPPVMCPADRTFRAQIGPSGGDKGYPAITGEVGWGLTWYINGVLIPEITLERGKTYTFIVEGGNDPENEARSHPLYITDDPEGGYEHKTAAEKKKVKIYAGVTKDRRGHMIPTVGRMCEWRLPKDRNVEDFDTFEEFQESLELRCERGNPGSFTFRPDKDTPDLLYYQCFTHRFLGWKIHVVDSCDSKDTSLTSGNRSRRPQSTSVTSQRKPQPIGPRYVSRASDARHGSLHVSPAWTVPPVMCPADRTFRAQIGPSGGDKGYPAITGGVGWDLSWYINGILIPEITLERGKSYTFIVEGGNDPETQARYHPFYITDDPEGGYEHKTAAERKKVKIYAGVKKDRRGHMIPTVGRMCEWRLPKDRNAEDFDTFEEFQESLELRCERGKPGRFTFRPDEDTPDLLYYQCFTHRFLGWKIHVVDSCDSRGLRHEASIQHVRNITYNTFESDYRRGGDKKKLGGSTSVSSSPKYFGGNDGIPLDLTETSDQKEDTKQSSKDAEDQKNLYHRPSSTMYYSSPTHYYSSSITDTSDLYFKPTTSAHKKYFQTTPESKSHYYKTSTTRSPSTKKYIFVSTTKKSTPTMEPFRMRDVIHTNKPRNYYPHQKAKASTAPKTVVNPGQTAPLKLRLYVSTSKPQRPPTKAPYSGTTRGQHPWWNTPSASSGTRQQAVNSLRNQLSYVQASNPNSRPQNRRPQQATSANAHYERSFIPVVIRNNGSFESLAAGSASRGHYLSHPSGHLLALSTATHNGKSIIPVLVRAKEPVRRTIGSTNKNGLHTPLGRLPYPNTSSRTASQGQKPVGESYLPLLVPHQKNKTKNSGQKKRIAPLIPLVVPEKKDDNLYILHQMLSLLNENPQSIAARGIKIVGNDKDTNVRTRIVRSANHDGHDHDHDHDGHDHDGHDHKEHEKHEKEQSEKSRGNMRLLSSYLLSAVLFIAFWQFSKNGLN